MDKTQESKSGETGKISKHSIALHLTVAEFRATVAEKYCTKEDADRIKEDLHKRIDDVRDTRRSIVVPFMVALVLLTAAMLGVGVQIILLLQKIFQDFG